MNSLTGKVERHKTVTRLDLGIMVKGRHYLLNLIWVICLRYINGRLYLLMVLDLFLCYDCKVCVIKFIHNL